MNNEKIISTIETFVSTLENSDKELYTKTLAALDTKLSVTVYAPVQNLALLVSDLKRELAETEIKKSKGNTFLKRSKLAEKLITQNRMERLQKGWIETDAFENKYQCFMTEYCGFMLSENLSIPMHDEQDEKPFNMLNLFKLERILQNTPENSTEYDIGKIKAEYKSHKPKAKDKWNCIVQFGDVYFNAKYFIDAVDVLGRKPAFHLGEKNSASFFVSENGKAVLMPINPAKTVGNYIFGGEKK